MTQILNFEVDVDRVVEHLDQEGMFVLRNFISKETIEGLKLEGHNLYRNAPKFSRNTRLGDSKGSYRINVVPERVRRFGSDREIEMIKGIIDHPRIRSLVDAALRSKSGVSNYIYDYSTVDSEKEASGAQLFPLHYDWRLSRCVKVYIYLTDVGVDQGAIRYIPYSQHLVRYLWANKTAALQEIMDREASYNQLEPLLTVVSEDIEADYPRGEVIDNLRGIASDLDQSYDFSIPGKSGDVLLFDENGIHGGGPIKSDYRFICRIHYVDRDYVNRRLPEQQTAARRFLWRLQAKLKRVDSLFS